MTEIKTENSDREEKQEEKSSQSQDHSWMGKSHQDYRSINSSLNFGKCLACGVDVLCFVLSTAH